MKQLFILALLLVTLVIPASVQAVTFDGGASTTGTLILDNKDGATWQRIEDGKYGVFTYNSSGDTLDWSLAVAGLSTTPTAYSLIYFADPYPGNNPGKLIWSGTSTSAGRIDVGATSIDIGMDLPSAPDSNMLVSHAGAPDNYATPLGAKIWLIPSAYYDATLKKVTAWNATVISSILFETDLILYTDTNKGGTGLPLSTTVTVPPATLSVAVSPPTGLAFGSVNIGACSTAGANIITLTNNGTVPITVAAIPTAGFYASSLKFGGVLATAWTSGKMLPGATLNLDAQVCPLPGVTGTITGSVAFVATFAP